MQMPAIAIVIDGSHFQTLEGFFQHFQERALGGAEWGNNLDAFNDVLRGGFGTPETGFALVWLNHSLSKRALGYEETVRQLKKRRKACHPANVKRVEADLEAAERRIGPTVYDWLVEIIRDHGSGGTQCEDRVELQLA